MDNHMVKQWITIATILYNNNKIHNLGFLSHALHFFSSHLVSSGVRWSKVCGSAGDNALYVSHHLWPPRLLQKCSSHGLGRGKNPAQPCKPLFCSYLQTFHWLKQSLGLNTNLRVKKLFSTYFEAKQVPSQVQKSGRTWREWVGREVGGVIGMWKTCEPKAFSFQCMTKFTTNKNKKKIYEVRKYIITNEVMAESEYFCILIQSTSCLY